jgi:HPt (histidine-containing phosphotransfer) domain-containing protein
MNNVAKRIFTYIQDTLGIDDSEVANELLREYCVTLQEYLSKIPRCLEQADNDGLYQAAHSLKGCSGNVGHEQVHELCLQLEDFARAKDFVAARTLVSQLQNIAQEMCDAG